MTAQIATALGPALDEPGALQQPSTVHVSEGVNLGIALKRADVCFRRVRLNPVKCLFWLHQIFLTIAFPEKGPLFCTFCFN
jgi:hypothetical protein